MEKALCVDTLKKFDGWADYIELTERRNLFVHSNGVVDSQYLTECKKNNYETKGISVGSQLLVDTDYFVRSYNLLYLMGIVLSQILLNKLYIGSGSPIGNTEDRDKLLIETIFDLICEKHYDVAIAASKVCLTSEFKHTSKDRSFIILNLAQSFKWYGQNKDCIDVLAKEDTTAWGPDLLIPKFTLEDNYEKVYQLMISLGANSNILNKEAYRTWPIFKEIRKERKFADTFKYIFTEELLNEKTTIKVEEEDGSSLLIDTH
ncbi:MAG: hypothetical protein IKP54_07420 [Bacteroidales bacterium]|nr:hypothetical protein [Bacteroidales bacterium]